MYHCKSWQNFSAKRATFKTSSSLKSESLASMNYNISSTTTSATLALHIKYKISNARLFMLMSWSFIAPKIYFKYSPITSSQLSLSLNLHTVSKAKYRILGSFTWMNIPKSWTVSFRSFLLTCSCFINIKFAASNNTPWSALFLFWCLVTSVFWIILLNIIFNLLLHSLPDSGYSNLCNNFSSFTYSHGLAV